MLPIPVGSCPLGLFFIDSGEEILIALVAHANVPESLIELLQFAEELDSFWQSSSFDVERCSLLILPLISKDVCLENLGIDLAAFALLVSISNTEFSKREIF